jgi:hypothetical protein
MANALNSLLMVRAGANQYFRLTNRSQLPPNRAVVHFLDKDKKPTGIVAVYEFIQPATESKNETDITYLKGGMSPSKAIAIHARELKMVTNLISGGIVAFAKVTFHGKQLPSNNLSWAPCVYGLVGDDYLQVATESKRASTRA